MRGERPIVKVAVPVPLRRTFDYLAGAAAGSGLAPGVRVRVPFGRRRLVGVVIGDSDASEVDAARLKRVGEVLDSEPLLAAPALSLLKWAAAYYHHPIGEVVHAALPASLRRGDPATLPRVERWAATGAGLTADAAQLARAPLQRRLLAELQQHPGGVDAARLRVLSAGWRAAARALQERGWVEVRSEEAATPPAQAPVPGPVLTADQQRAVEVLHAGSPGFTGFLLHGVTGSGKTEVYLRAVEQALAAGRQALILVPEIGLTPQLVRRVSARVGVPVAVLHSGLSDPERTAAWLAAGNGSARVVLGTRSAVFTPLAAPGVIVVDEEHDASFKQQDGFRYHARDVALKRGQLEDIPVILGSATPSLESMHNTRTGRLRLLELPARTGAAVMPEVRLLDLRRLPARDALSRPLVEALRARQARGEQSLLFLNRRGFAPVMMCYECGWIAPCARCDARLTFHRASGRLRCHHCGADARAPDVCPACGAGELHPLGEGTERIEEALAARLPEARIVRIDRDTTRRKGSLENMLGRIRAGEADVLVGTQMLSKGHHFPNVTLVGVLNADQGLYGLDFRSGERLVQQILQVAGRAGRGDKPGEVYIQTHHPDSPYFAALHAHDYGAFVDVALAERREAGLPPFSHLALLRAESPVAGDALGFLREAHAAAKPLSPQDVTLLEPVPSPMERRAGRSRAQLLVQAGRRAALHGFLDAWLDALDALPGTRRVRWSLDVDPVDMY